MILATANTGNFEFQTLATDRGTADKQLLAAWKKHVKEYGGAARVDTKMMQELIREGEVNYVEINLGETARDGEVLR